MTRLLSTFTRSLKAPLLARGIATSQTLRAGALSINNIEHNFKQLSVQEQEELTSQIENLEKQDWSKLSLEEKRAAYYVAFGPHGTREPAPKIGFNVLLGTIALVGAGALTFFGIRAFGGPNPHTLTKEWQEATNEYMKEQKANPITGFTSPNYKGKGWVDC